MNSHKSQGSLIAIERNALTYAGYTVWNQRQKHKPTREDKRRTMLWRPKSEWIITPKSTHEPLITRAEADRILAAVDKGNPKPGMRLRKPDQFLLTGLLYSPEGKPFQGDGKFYRGGRRGTRLLRAAVDKMVLSRIATEIRGKEFVGKVVQAAHDLAEDINDNPAAVDQALRGVEAKIARVTDMVAETGNRALVAKLDELEIERTGLLAERAQAADRARMKKGLRSLTTRGVEAMLEFSAVPVEGAPGADVPYLRTTLAALVRRIELDAATRKVQVHYSVPFSGAKLASPARFELALTP